jgi:hypothetical protein
MARRQAGKANPTSAAARTRDRREKLRTTSPEGATRERVAAIERERDMLRAELEREQARGRKLEEANAAARDRVAWALDTLNNILEAKH